jgi:hypothetical protein
MDTIKRLFAKALVLFVAVVAVALLAAGPAAPPASAGGFTTLVGGIPVAITTHGNSSSTPIAVTWTTPPNFTPDYIRCVDELDGDASIYEWWVGMANNTAHKTTSGTNISTYVSTGGSTCGFGTATAGTITIAAACQQASESYSCLAIRYEK